MSLVGRFDQGVHPGSVCGILVSFGLFGLSVDSSTPPTKLAAVAKESPESEFADVLRRRPMPWAVRGDTTVNQCRPGLLTNSSLIYESHIVRAKNYRLHLELLEDRRLLAGNVSAAMSGGNLVIDGDNAANRISVESAGTGKIAVRGFQTQINGVPGGIKVFTGVTGDIQIQLDGGDDLVRVTNLITPGGVLVGLGEGNDEVVTGRDKLQGNDRFAGSPSGPLYVKGALRLYGGEGQDLVYQSDAHIAGLGVTNLGGGNDTLFTQRPGGSAQNVDYGRNLSILPAGGDDVIDILGMSVEDDLTINDGSGRLYLYIRSLDVHGNFTITSAAQADSVDVSATNVRNQFVVNSGAGHDRVRLSVIANKLHVNLGDGDDGCELASANVKQSTLFGGAGNDVFLARYAYGVDAYFSGGSGRDAFRTSRSLPNQLSSLRTEAIENIESLV